MLETTSDFKRTFFVDMWDLGSVFGPKIGKKFLINSENRKILDERDHKNPKP